MVVLESYGEIASAMPLAERPPELAHVTTEIVRVSIHVPDQPFSMLWVVDDEALGAALIAHHLTDSGHLVLRVQAAETVGFDSLGWPLPVLAVAAFGKMHLASLAPSVRHLSDIMRSQGHRVEPAAETEPIYGFGIEPVVESLSWICEGERQLVALRAGGIPLDRCWSRQSAIDAIGSFAEHWSLSALATGLLSKLGPSLNPPKWYTGQYL